MKNTFKLELAYAIGDETGRLDISADNCANWRDVTLAYKRSDMDGVTRAFSTSFDFIGNAAEVVTNIADIWCGTDIYSDERYEGRQATDYCRVELRMLREDWTYPQDADYACDLDFATARRTRGKFTVAAIDGSLAAMLKNAGGTSYTLTPFNQQERVERHVVYDGLYPTQRVYVDIAAPTGSAGDYTPTAKSFPLTLNGDNRDDFITARSYGDRMVTIGGVNVYVVSDSGNTRRVTPSWEDWAHDYTSTSPRLVTFGLVTGSKSVDVRVVFTWRYTGSQQTVRLLKKNTGTTAVTQIAVDTGIQVSASGNTRIVTYTLTGTADFVRNDYLDIVFDGAPTNLGSIDDDYDAMVYLSAPNKGVREVIDIPALTPAAMAEALSEMITGRTGEDAAIRVQENSTLANTFIFSKGWFNGGNSSATAEMNVSYNDFRDWLGVVFDYVPVMHDTGDAATSYVEFVSRDAAFGTDVTAYIPYEAVAEPTLSARAALMYRRVVAGYEAQSYDDTEAGAGGFNVPVTYDVATPANSDRTLELKSAWRADTYGFEELLSNFDTRDTESGDIFFLHGEQYIVPEVDDRYSSTNPYFPLVPSEPGAPSVYYFPDRTTMPVTSTDAADVRPARYVNAVFCPAEIMRNNDFRVLPSMGTPADARLKYVSQDGGDVRLSIDGVAVTADIVYTEGRFNRCPRPLELSFTYSPIDIDAMLTFVESGGGELLVSGQKIFAVRATDGEMAYLPWDALVEVDTGAYIVRGWVQDMKFHILHRQSVDCTLLVQSIKKKP